MTMIERKVYTVEEVSIILGIPTSTLYERVREGRAGNLGALPGKPVRFSRRVIDAVADGVAA